MTYLSSPYLKLEYHSGLNLHQFSLQRFSIKDDFGCQLLKAFYTHCLFPDVESKRLFLGVQKMNGLFILKILGLSQYERIVVNTYKDSD